MFEIDPNRGGLAERSAAGHGDRQRPVAAVALGLQQAAGGEAEGVDRERIGRLRIDRIAADVGFAVGVDVQKIAAADGGPVLQYRIEAVGRVVIGHQHGAIAGAQAQQRIAQSLADDAEFVGGTGGEIDGKPVGIGGRLPAADLQLIGDQHPEGRRVARRIDIRRAVAQGPQPVGAGAGLVTGHIEVVGAWGREQRNARRQTIAQVVIEGDLGTRGIAQGQRRVGKAARAVVGAQRFEQVERFGRHFEAKPVVVRREADCSGKRAVGQQQQRGGGTGRQVLAGGFAAGDAAPVVVPDDPAGAGSADRGIHRFGQGDGKNLVGLDHPVAGDEDRDRLAGFAGRERQDAGGESGGDLQIGTDEVARHGLARTDPVAHARRDRAVAASGHRERELDSGIDRTLEPVGQAGSDGQRGDRFFGDVRIGHG